MKFDLGAEVGSFEWIKQAKREEFLGLIRRIYSVQQQILPSEAFAEIWGLEGLDEDQLWGILSLVNGEILGKVASVNGAEAESEVEAEAESEGEFEAEDGAEVESEGEDEGGSENESTDSMESIHSAHSLHSELLSLHSAHSEDEELLQKALDNYHSATPDDQISDSDISMSSDCSSQGKDAKFADFFSEAEGPEFDSTNEFNSDDSSQPRMLNLDSEEEEDNNAPQSSTFEKQQAKLAAEISHLEQENIAAEKPWTLRGEVQAASRPLDSLLQVDVEFENATKPVPVITKEHCDSIEALIIQRIKDGVFDDPERKMHKEASPALAAAQIELSMQKSTQSLAEIYASDEIEHSAPAAPNEQHKQIRALFSVLSSKLDALCNYHQMPQVKASREEISIVSQAPAVTLEESVPSTASNATLLAPQEVYPQAKKMPGSYSEQSKTQKRLLAKKSAQRKRQRMNSSASDKQKAVKELSKQRNVTLGGAFKERRV